MKQNNKILKPDHLCDELFRQIQKGLLKAGGQVPAERQLANAFGMSYMTARQAVQMLVDQGYLVKRSRVGTFVPFDIQERLSHLAINIIGVDSEATLAREFTRRVQFETMRLGVFGNMIAVADGNVDQMIRILNNHDRPCIVLMNPYLVREGVRQAFLNHPRLIVVGHNFSGMGIPSVLCDDAAAARIATGLLQEQGHRKIAFVGNDFSHPVMQQMIAGWRSSFVRLKPDLVKQRQIEINNPENMEKNILRRMARGQWDVTATISSNPELAIGMVRTFQSLGIKIPQEQSLVTLGLAEDLPHYTPIVTCVDPHLEEQVLYAMERACDMAEGKAVDLLNLVMPRIIDGQTVAGIKIR
jgi:DNA-binding LacI/PurR family transcriptional regulator